MELPAYPWLDHNRECPLDPPRRFADLRSACPVAPVRTAMGAKAWLVTRHEDARFVLGDRRFSADRAHPGFPHVGPPRPVPPGNFVHIDPPGHTRLRRLVSRHFTVRTVGALRPKIQRYAEELTDEIARCGPPADLMSMLALPLPVRVISELVGVPRQDASIFPKATSIFMPSTATPELTAAKINEVKRYVAGLVAAKARDPGDDLISALIREHGPEGELTHPELIGLALVLMFGGYETTSNTLALGFTLLLRDQRQAALVQRNPALAKGAVEEILRFLSVVHTGLPRLATEDVMVGGRLVRAGEGVIVSLASADRDPAVFTDPDRFDIRRFDGHREAHHLAFGYGIHQCIGQMLARLQLRIAVQTALARLPRLRLAVPVEDLPFRHDMFIYGLHKLPVRWGDALRVA